MSCRGGIGLGLGQEGKKGTISGKACPKGLYGIFCLVIVETLLCMNHNNKYYNDV